MQSRSIFREPDYVPTKWLIGLTVLCLSAIAGAITVGIWIERLDASINAEEKIMIRLNSIDHRLSTIEGRLIGK